MPPSPTPETPRHNQQQVGAMLQFLKARAKNPEPVHPSTHTLPKLFSPDPTKERVQGWLEQLNVGSLDWQAKGGDEPILHVLSVVDLNPPNTKFVAVGTDEAQVTRLAAETCPGSRGTHHYRFPISALQAIDPSAT